MPLGDIQENSVFSLKTKMTNNKPLCGKYSNQRAYLTMDNSVPYFGENAIENPNLKTTNLEVRFRYSVKQKVAPWYKITCDIISNEGSATLRVANYDDMLKQAKNNKELAYIIKYVPQLNKRMFEIAQHNPNLTFKLSFDYDALVKDKGCYNFCEVTDVILKSMKKYNKSEYEFLVNERGYPEV